MKFFVGLLRSLLTLRIKENFKNFKDDLLLFEDLVQPANPVHEIEAKSAQGMMDLFTDLRQEFATFRKDICDKDDTSKLICSKITSKSDNQKKSVSRLSPETTTNDLIEFFNPLNFGIASVS
ncbi:hypothetical protein TNIN_136071 [Trichonephila inaurata madagascariensis]|uniref:Uncharacterized protein n=1 Tax=Trichonephila inaurata madagascariensis TaxID=2747483 RepID=A0A8X6XFT3_9ARAC|nr:hypothetical protein TNIN_136071 [Trichonephila inaurata madagascariensis]